MIKIEPPEGDTLRAWRIKGIETAWKVYSRNKKSVALDLRSDAGRTIVRELAKSAQILVESFRPGVLEDMGLAPAELHALNPRLVIVRISGWGQDGRYPPQAGLRHADRGLFRLRLDERLRRSRAGAAADVSRRRHGGALRLRRGHGRAARGRDERRQGPGDRPAAVRSAVLDAGPAGRQLQAHRRGQAAHRQPLDQRRAAQRLPDQGRPLGLPVGLDAGHGRARAGQDRPAGAGQRSALRHQHRAREERRRARRDHRRLHRRSATSPRTCATSTRPASPSARSTTSPRSCRTTTCWSARR